MDPDQVYVDRLLAILTNPSPTGVSSDDPYGMADDRIDRYDGFGTDVWVTSIAIVRDGPWDELEVHFERSTDPRSGSVRVEFDREWRELSLYDEPSAYAPTVARSVEMAARRLRSASRSDPTPVPSGRIPDVAALWSALLRGLSAFGTVREVAPGRIEVEHPGDAYDAPSAFTVVVTPEQWAGLTSYHQDVDLSLADLIGPRDDDESFVVFYRAGLDRSVREELPPVRSTRWLRDLADRRAKDPRAPFGWFAYRPIEEK